MIVWRNDLVRTSIGNGWLNPRGVSGDGGGLITAPLAGASFLQDVI